VRGDPLATDQSQPTSYRYLAFYHLAPRTLPSPSKSGPFYKVQIEDRVRKIRYGRIWFQLVLSLSIALWEGDRWINKTIVNNWKICVCKWWTLGKLDQMGVRPTHFQIGTIIITLRLSHHRTSLSPLFKTFLLSYVWVAVLRFLWCAGKMRYMAISCPVLSPFACWKFLCYRPNIGKKYQNLLRTWLQRLWTAVTLVLLSFQMYCISTRYIFWYHCCYNKCYFGFVI